MQFRITKWLKVAIILGTILLAAGLLWSGNVFAKPAASASNQTVPKEHPPFFLRNENGEVINPITGENADQPYSPRQTCGAEDSKNYEEITGGYHFQQGGDVLDDNRSPEQPWVMSDGMFGKF